MAIEGNNILKSWIQYTRLSVYIVGYTKISSFGAMVGLLVRLAGGRLSNS